MKVWNMSKTGYTCIRHSLCIMNLIFWLIGCSLLGIGIWLYSSFDTYNRILPAYHLLSADNLIIVAGSVMMIIAFSGCCGAWFQSKLLLYCFLSLIVLVMLLQITAGLLGFVFRHTIKETLHTELMDSIKEKYEMAPQNSLRATWDNIQISLNCCGVDNYTDWYDIKAWPDKTWVPKSCCQPLANQNASDTCGQNPEKDVELFRKSGCYNKIRLWLLQHLHIVAITCIVFSFIQFFSIVSSLLIICTMDYKTRYQPTNGSCRSTYNRVPTL